MIRLPQLMYGIFTFVPGVSRLFRGGAGNTLSARYCYTVWMRHLLHGLRQGMASHPKVVAELGPGNSLGVGLAALISGANQYVALDVESDASCDQNLMVFEQLIALFGDRAVIPGDDEFPEVLPTLPSYRFPSEVLTDERLAESLAPDRLDRIRAAIRRPCAGSMIDYRAPWYDDTVIEDNLIDMVLSQAVLEHAEALDIAYRAMGRWMRPAGLMSHQIDFRCHGTAREWNGHWALSDASWRLVKGRRPYMLNREPYSTHLGLLREHGFSVTGQQLCSSASRICRGQLVKRFAHLTDQDLTISSAFIQAVKGP